MIESVSFWEEFKAEVDIVISHDNSGGILSIVLEPLKIYFKDEKRSSLLAYSLARFCGATPRAAFLMEWAHTMYELPKDYTHLFEINRKYLQSSLPAGVLALPVICDEVEEDAASTIITEQMRFIYQTFVRMRREVITKNPSLENFLTNELFDRISAHQIFLKRPEYAPPFQSDTSTQFLEHLKYSSSLVSVGLSTFAGLNQYLHASQNMVDPNKVKWSSLWEICENIVVVHELKKNKYVSTFAKSQSFDNDQKRSWYCLSLDERIDVAEKDDIVQKKINELALKVKEKTLEQIVRMSFPIKHKETLIRLLVWCYDPEEEYDMGDFL